MFKSVQDKVWAFDAEWVPDPLTGRAVYGLPAELPDEEIVAEMWRRGGASEEEPRPYLKTVLCRVVSISVLAPAPLLANVVATALRSMYWVPAMPSSVSFFDLTVMKSKPGSTLATT